jgi:ribosome maturation factor RimP
MTISVLRTAAVIGLCALCLSVAAAQAPDKPRTGQTAPEGAPGDEHKKLDTLAGAWDVSLKIPVAGGRVIQGKSSCEAKWVLDGRFMRLEYSSTFAGKPLTVLRYVGFDRHKGKFVEIHFESTHTDVMHAEGDISGDGKTITCTGTHVDSSTGKAVNVQTVTTISDRDNFTLEMSYLDPAGTKVITLTHKRKSNAT